MGKKILDSKLLYALLAIVIAIGMWFYVVTVEGLESETDIAGVPVTFLNEDVLEEKGLMITSGKDQRVSLTVAGSLTNLAKLEREKENITVSIDVGKITTPGDQRLAYNVTLPTGYNSSVDVTGQYPNNIDFTVSRRIKKEVAVEGKFTGSLASGYMRDDFAILPERIEVYGIESEVNQIAKAVVYVGGEELTETVTGDLPFVLIGYQDQELDQLDVTCSAETVFVTLPIVKTADIPLSVKLISGGGVPVSDEYVDCRIEPEFITVSGAEDDLDPLKEIVLGQIELADIITSETFEYEIPLNEALTNISGKTTAKVTVTIKGLESKVLEVDNIQLINVPEGFDGQAVTQTLQVMVRGPKNSVELVLAHNVRAVANLSTVDPSVGRYTVSAKVYLDGTADVGVVGDDYKIVVDLAEAAEETAEETAEEQTE